MEVNYTIAKMRSESQEQERLRQKYKLRQLVIVFVLFADLSIYSHMM